LIVLKYGVQIQATAVPVDIVESKNGITFVTSFTELIPYTLVALLQGYGCSSDMLKRIEYDSSIFSYKLSPIDIFITSNVHTFAACCTNRTKSIRNEKEQEYLDQVEIFDLIESFEGSFESPGTYVNISRLTPEDGLKSISFNYSYPIFETGMRYLVFLKQSFHLDGVNKERYLLILYIPEQVKEKRTFSLS
jgi:hypothetical protein